ncbi:MAG: hypothetical protein AAFU86_11105 [Pseudomonadota bacterium]
MVDQNTVKTALNAVILELDPAKHDVAIAHLNDAIAAIDAVQGGGATKYALHAKLIEGEANVRPLRRRLR